jgi:hypothetical protein
MPRKKSEVSDTAIARATIELPTTDVVKVEKNLTSLGFFTPSSKAIKGAKAKTITFTRMVEGRKVEAKVTIAPAAIYGLPVTADQDKYFALQKIISDIRQEFGIVKNPVSFSSAEILNLLGKSDAGKNYREILEWLKRMTSTTIISEGAVYFAGRKKWAQDTFHVFDRSVAIGQELPNGDVADKNYIWLSEWQIENINNNHLLPVDFETYKNLKSHNAKALVPLLQIWLFASAERGIFEKRYDELCQHLNISRCKQVSKIKERLGPALDELKSYGYISKWKIEPTSDKKSFKVVFYHGEKFHRDRRQRLGQGDGSDRGQPSGPVPIEVKEESRLPGPPDTPKVDTTPAGAEDPVMTRRVERLIEVGFGRSPATHLASKYGDECDRQLDALSWRDFSKINDRIAWLRCAIEQGYALPPAPEQGSEAKQEKSQKVAECPFCKDSGTLGMRRIINEKYPRGAWKKCSHDLDTESQYTAAD